jgi:hypothetical protein
LAREAPSSDMPTEARTPRPSGYVTAIPSRRRLAQPRHSEIAQASATANHQARSIRSKVATSAA